MDHQAIHDQLFALYDGELTGAARHVLEEHLLDCAECRAIMAQWKHVAKALFQAPTLSTSEAFVRRVMQRVASSPAQRFRLPVPRFRLHSTVRQAGLRRWILQGGWLLPIAGLAAIWFVMMRGFLPQTVSIESLLLSDGREPAVLQRVLTGERANAEDILGLLGEEVS